MEKYKNRGGRSGVVGYLSQPDSLTVKFRDGVSYRYTTIKPGPAKLAELKRLALRGEGLNSYINKSIGKNYDKKYP